MKNNEDPADEFPRDSEKPIRRGASNQNGPGRSEGANNTSDQALDSVESIFKTIGWSYERKSNPNGVFSGFNLDKQNKAHIVIMPDDSGYSLLMGCAYHFTPPKGQLGKIRRLFQKEALNINDLSIQFEPRRGVRLSGRCWLPKLDLSQEDLANVIHPYFNSLIVTCTRLYPELIKLLRHYERIKPQDDFHLPA